MLRHFSLSHHFEQITFPVKLLSSNIFRWEFILSIDIWFWSRCFQLPSRNLPRFVVRPCQPNGFPLNICPRYFKNPSPFGWSFASTCRQLGIYHLKNPLNIENQLRINNLWPSTFLVHFRSIPNCYQDTPFFVRRSNFSQKEVEKGFKSLPQKYFQEIVLFAKDFIGRYQIS